MSKKLFPTANSRKLIAYDNNWRVLDIGSGYNPHPRADILADKFLGDNTERTGRDVLLVKGKPFVMADACHLPFATKSIDFIICSHIAEHVDEPENFCYELTRVSHAGYIETPSVFTEKLLHVALHRWYVFHKGKTLYFAPTPDDHPRGKFGKLFFSLYFYNMVHLKGRDIYPFANGVKGFLHFFFLGVRSLLRGVFLVIWPAIHTRFLWRDQFEVKRVDKPF